MGRKIANQPGMRFDQIKRRWVKKENYTPAKVDFNVSLDDSIDKNIFAHRSILKRLKEFDMPVGVWGSRRTRVTEEFFDSNTYPEEGAKEVEFPGAMITPPVFEEDGESGLGPTYSHMKDSIVRVTNEGEFTKAITGFPDNIPPAALDELRDAGLFDSDNWYDIISECYYYGDAYMESCNQSIEKDEIFETLIHHTYNCTVGEYREKVEDGLSKRAGKPLREW